MHDVQIEDTFVKLCIPTIDSVIDLICHSVPEPGATLSRERTVPCLALPSCSVREIDFGNVSIELFYKISLEI